MNIKYGNLSGWAKVLGFIPFVFFFAYIMITIVLGYIAIFPLFIVALLDGGDAIEK